MTQEKLTEEEKPFRQDIYYTFAQRIADGEAGDFVYCLHDDNVYLYEDGVWRIIFLREFINICSNKIINKKGNKILTKLDINFRKKVIENFKVIKYIHLEKFNMMPLINFSNCMFDVVGMNILAHKSEYYSTIRIPYKYDELASCDLWVKTLMEIFENNEEKINLLQEFLGYCISSNNEQKKGLLLLGDTDTGKSTIIDIFREVAGEQNISNVPLEKLSDAQYTPLLINKLVNIDPEVNKNSANYEREFKIITGGKNERVSCNQKHIPTFEFTPKCKIILSANIFPKITDHSSAFYQRLLIIPCERRFQENEKNRNLHIELMTERSGIFNWLIKGLARLNKRGKFEHPDFMKDAVEELEDENNPVNNFFKDHIEVDNSADFSTEKGFLYEQYKKWSDSKREYPLSVSRFSNCVYRKYHTYTPKNTQDMKTRKRIWRNIIYVENKNQIQQKDIGWQ